MTMKEKLERVLNTPDTVYLFSAKEIHYEGGLYGEMTSRTVMRGVRGRLREYRDGLLYIETGGTIQTLLFEDLTEIQLPGPKPITRNKIGFEM